jgi:hypothetical protein
MMAGRLLGALLCAFLLCAASFDVYAAAAQKNFSAILEFETSFTSLDSLDDFNEGGFPGRTVDWSSRAKSVAKWMLGSIPRRSKLAPPTIALCKQASHSRQAFQDLYRFQEVCRI